MKFTEYTTVEGDRWDLIAYRAYGDPGRVDGIIRSNPGLAVNGLLPAGITLQIPVIPEETANETILPPWKR